MWSEKLNNRRSDGGMTGDVCYRICTIDRSHKRNVKSNRDEKKKEKKAVSSLQTFKFVITNQIEIGPLNRAGVGPHPLQWIEIWNEPARQPTGGQ